MIPTELPNAFVWTKIAADAGQPLRSIFNRKELERCAGGTLWWGIGTGLDTAKVGQLVAADPRPTVIFSEMRSVAHSRDSNPDGVLLWEAYETTNGRISLPPHAIVISRAHDSRGNPKSRYYALVCETKTGILRTAGGAVNTSTLRNFGDGGKSIGSSQITSLVQRINPNNNGLSYPITIRGTLVAPYSVRLTAPRALLPAELQLLQETSLDGKTPKDWLATARRLRRG
jgi:hypothetical protein